MVESVLSADSALMNTYARIPIHFQKGKGSFLWDVEGNRYLDFTSGIATCNLGHVPKKVKEAVASQLEELWHCSNLFLIKQQEALASKLTEVSCMDQAFFCNSGAEANEAAIKLARKYAQKLNQNGNPIIVTFTNSFHGRTLATLSATGQEKIQTGFAPLMPGFQYLPYNDLASLKKLETIKPCAVMLELIQGEGGVLPADQDWIDALTAVCAQNNILIIVDEVQTGIGRTGTLFAYEQYGFEPDIMTLAKGLGSGFPIGAMLAKKEAAAAFQPGSHGSTFGGNPLASSAGLATLNEITGQNILENVKSMGKYLWEQLEKLQSNSPNMKQVHGKGLIVGIDVEGEAGVITREALKEHLLILTAGPSVVRILPPLTVDKTEIDLFIQKLKNTFKTLTEQTK
ncbi:acetylornithine transaminase [Heyndrickxia acidicola]|uniref:Acetylornithine aminotransferase n=1 Tax=Heyndrickxia acidicola TaxID=209389 RepID=A0ABU6MI22_9BACI|nr:acetylornithine transaminase [Heyndrickxia acidicola]MED1204048.1 acetylornithine transaminase [Heyndrickxia acidicola]